MALSETLHAAGFIISLAAINGSLENGTLITGQNLKAGTVLGRITVDTATSAAKSGGNTGGGSCTMDGTTPVLARAVPGVYKVRCVGLVANGGVFAVTAPDDRFVGIAYAGVAFDKELKFVLADTGTDFAIGDGFDITVTAGSGKYTQLSRTALDGSQVAAGILYAPTNATDADQSIALVRRNAEVNSNELTWPSGITDAEKAIATAALEARGVVLR